VIVAEVTGGAISRAEPYADLTARIVRRVRMPRCTGESSPRPPGELAARGAPVPRASAAGSLPFGRWRTARTSAMAALSLDQRENHDRRFGAASAGTFAGVLAHWHRWAFGTWPNTCSTCWPQPFQEGRPHVLHVTCLHIPPRVSGSAVNRVAGGTGETAEATGTGRCARGRSGAGHPATRAHTAIEAAWSATTSLAVPRSSSTRGSSTR